MLFIPIEYYMVWIVEVFVMGTLHSFGNDNSNHSICVAVVLVLVLGCYMSWLWYWKVLITGMLYGFAIIIEPSLNTIANIQF